MKTKKDIRLTSEESQSWLRSRMAEVGISSFDELQEFSGIDKGSISRYFRRERIPGIDVVEPLCKALKVSPETILSVLGAISRRRS